MAVDLTPGQALVLLDPAKRQGRDILKLSLMWMLAQGYVRAETVRSWRMPKVAPGHRRVGRTWTRIVMVRPLPETLPEELRAVAELVIAAPDGYLDQIMLKAVETYGYDLDGLRTQLVIPTLERRRLLEWRDMPFLLVLTRRRPVHTIGGEIAKREVESQLALGRTIPEYLDRSPAQAAAMAVALGSLVLLLPELRPHLSAMAQAARPPAGSSDGAGESGGGSGASSSDGGGGLWSPNGTGGPKQPSQPADTDGGLGDLGGFDLSALDALDADALAAALDAMDASVDSAASDAGTSGDGGGGDGGGGGD